MEKELAKSQSREKTNKDQGRLERTAKLARTNFNEVLTNLKQNTKVIKQTSYIQPSKNYWITLDKK